jgi:hypothetical protein
LNWRWPPLAGTRYQPSSSISFMTSRTFIFRIARRLVAEQQLFGGVVSSSQAG